MFAYYPIPGGPDMEFCTVGNHVIAPGTEGVVVRQGGRYCPEHVPPEFIQEKELDPTPETAPWKMTDRQRKAVGFQKWRYERGFLEGDDYAEDLTDADKSRLAPHFRK